MARIPETNIPFPHREGNLFKIQYLVYWTQEGEEESDKHIIWLRKLYTYMTIFVSSNRELLTSTTRILTLGRTILMTKRRISRPKYRGSCT
ncbi:Berberine bridge enzyme-like 26 [Linum perenne]